MKKTDAIRAKLAFQKAEKAVGGPSALGKALNITSQAISQWQHVPATRVIDVERITQVPRTELRPDLYPQD